MRHGTAKRQLLLLLSINLRNTQGILTGRVLSQDDQQLLRRFTATAQTLHELIWFGSDRASVSYHETVTLVLVASIYDR